MEGILAGILVVYWANLWKERCNAGYRTWPERCGARIVSWSTWTEQDKYTRENSEKERQWWGLIVRVNTQCYLSAIRANHLCGYTVVIFSLRKCASRTFFDWANAERAYRTNDDLDDVNRLFRWFILWKLSWCSVATRSIWAYICMGFFFVNYPELDTHTLYR